MTIKEMVFFLSLLTLALFLDMGYSLNYVNCESSSMEPTLTCNCIYLGKSVRYPQEIKTGDIISYKTQYQDEIIKVMHRVVSLDETTLTTKGDNNPREDIDITYSQIHSKVIWWWCLNE